MSFQSSARRNIAHGEKSYLAAKKVGKSFATKREKPDEDFTPQTSSLFYLRSRARARGFCQNCPRVGALSVLHTILRAACSSLSLG